MTLVAGRARNDLRFSAETAVRQIVSALGEGV